MSCNCEFTTCLTEDVYICDYTLDSAYKKIGSGEEFTASISATGRGPDLYTANVVAERNLKNTLYKLLKCERATVVEGTQKITKKCYVQYM